MLGKLLKFEIKATGRILLPLYGAMIVFALINRLFTVNGQLISNASWLVNATAFIMTLVYSIIIGATMVMTFTVMIQRYYKNLLGDEGYLMNTLPVRPSQHIASKLVTSIIWIFCTSIVTFISILIIAYEKGMFEEIMRSLSVLVAQIQNEIGFSPYFALFEMCLIGLSACIVSVLLIYCSISIGHLANKHRKLFAFGAFLVITFIIQFTFSCIGMVLEHANLYDWFTNLAPNQGCHYFTITSIGVNIIVGGIYFAISNYVMSKRLNLE